MNPVRTLFRGTSIIFSLFLATCVAILVESEIWFWRNKGKRLSKDEIEGAKRRRHEQKPQ